VFQDPFASLDPRMRVAEILEKASPRCADIAPAERTERVAALLERVACGAKRLTRYRTNSRAGSGNGWPSRAPWRFEPQLIVADEPTSALDVSVQAQILNCAGTAARLRGAYLFITHNFGAVEYLAHEIAVMKNGVLVEQGLRSGS